MIKPLTRVLFCAAMLAFATPCLAAGKPKTTAPAPVKPVKPPIRVPFSAFRTKPILDIYTDPDSPLKNAKGKKPILIHIRPMKITPVPKPAIIAAAPAPQAPQPAEDRAATFAGATPLPGHKPTTPDDAIIAMPAMTQPETAPPVENTPPAEETAQDAAVETAVVDVADAEAQADVDTDSNAPYVPPKRAHFDDDDRRTGAGFGMRRKEDARGDDSAVRIASLGSGDLRGMLQPDANGDISPVLIPGHTETVAAPDARKTDSSGLPAQVIVFFQDSSPKMEVGQLDVVNADVVSQLQDNPDLKLEIVGFSEKLDTGQKATDKMAAIRAAELRDYLKSQHIAPDRLTVTAKGDDTQVEPRDRVEMNFSE